MLRLLSPFLLLALSPTLVTSFTPFSPPVPSSASSASSSSTLLRANEATHDVKGGGAPPTPFELHYSAHQAAAPKLTFPESVRSLVQSSHGFAVISTNSKSNPGFPGGSVVAFSPDADGNPLFTFSGMSSHTQDLLSDGRASLTIAAKDFKGAADGRVNLMGTVELVKVEVREKCEEVYMERHPGAYW